MGRPCEVLTMLGLLSCLPASGCMDPVRANAGSDRTVDAGAEVTLDGSRSRPRDAKRLDFLWEVVDGPEVTLTNPQARTTTFTAPQQQTESTITVRLTVTYVDLGGQLVPSNRDTDEVLIQVRADPEAADTSEATDQAAEDTADAGQDDADSEAAAETEATPDTEAENANAASDQDVSSNGESSHSRPL